MLLAELLAALAVAAALSAVFVPLLGWSRRAGGARGAVLFFLVPVWLVTWGVAAWVRPVGPTVEGVPWLPFAFVGLATALALASASGPVAVSAAAAPAAAARREAPPAGAWVERRSPRSRLARLAARASRWGLLVLVAVALFVRYTFWT